MLFLLRRQCKQEKNPAPFSVLEQATPEVCLRRHRAVLRAVGTGSRTSPPGMALCCRSRGRQVHPVCRDVLHCRCSLTSRPGAMHRIDELSQVAEVVLNRSRCGWICQHADFFCWYVRSHPPTPGVLFKRSFVQCYLYRRNGGSFGEKGGRCMVYNENRRKCSMIRKNFPSTIYKECPPSRVWRSP